MLLISMSLACVDGFNVVKTFALKLPKLCFKFDLPPRFLPTIVACDFYSAPSSRYGNVAYDFHEIACGYDCPRVSKHVSKAHNIHQCCTRQSQASCKLDLHKSIRDADLS